MPRDWLWMVLLCIPMATGTLPAVALAQTAPPADAATLAALDLLEVVGTSKHMDNEQQQLVTAFAKTAALRDGGTKVDAATHGESVAMAKFPGFKAAMLNEMAALYARKFTTAELKVLADFYRTGPGAHFIQRQPELMQEGGLIAFRVIQKINEGMKQGAGQTK